MPAPYPQEFRDDVVRVARSREDGRLDTPWDGPRVCAAGDRCRSGTGPGTAKSAASARSSAAWMQPVRSGPDDPVALLTY